MPVPVSYTPQPDTPPSVVVKVFSMPTGRFLASALACESPTMTKRMGLARVGKVVEGAITPFKVVGVAPAIVVVAPNSRSLPLSTDKSIGVVKAKAILTEATSTPAAVA